MKKWMIVIAWMIALSVNVYGQTPLDNFRRSMDELFDDTWKEFAPDSIMENGCWSRVVEMELNAKDSYNAARSVLAKVIPNYQKRVKMEDEKSHKIICDIALKLSSIQREKGENYLLNGVYKFSLTLVFKDNRFLAKAENVTCDYVTKFMGSTLDSDRNVDYSYVLKATNGMLANDFRQQAGIFLRDFTSSLSSAHEEDNF